MEREWIDEASATLRLFELSNYKIYNYPHFLSKFAIYIAKFHQLHGVIYISYHLDKLDRYIYFSFRTYAYSHKT